MYIVRETELFSAHNARQAAIKITSSCNYEILTNENGDPVKDEYGNYIFTGKRFNPTVYLRMAKTLNPNIDMSKPIAKGTRVFDWENSVVLKLQNHEVAILSMLSNPFYLMKWNDLLVEEYNDKKNELFNVFHNSNRDTKESKILKIQPQSKYGSIQVAISVIHNKPDGSKDNMWISLKIHQAHELGLAMAGYLMNIGEYNVRFRDLKNNTVYKIETDNTNEEKQQEEDSLIDISDYFS